jgi:hypothetical protein
MHTQFGIQHVKDCDCGAPPLEAVPDLDSLRDLAGFCHKHGFTCKPVTREVTEWEEVKLASTPKNKVYCATGKHVIEAGEECSECG